MLSKFSVKRPYTVVVGVGLIISLIRQYDAGSASQHEPAICDSNDHLYRRKPGRGGRSRNQARRADDGCGQQYQDNSVNI